MSERDGGSVYMCTCLCLENVSLDPGYALNMPDYPALSPHKHIHMPAYLHAHTHT